MCGLSNIVFGGHDPRPGKGADYVCYIWLEGGWGGRVATRDGHTAMTLFGSSATNQPIEMQERVFPLRFTAYRYEPDTAGAGLPPRRLRRHEGVARDARRRGAVGHRRPRDARLLGLGRRPRTARRTPSTYAPGTDEEERVGMFRTGMIVREGRRLQLPPRGRRRLRAAARARPGVGARRRARRARHAGRGGARCTAWPIVEDASHPYGCVLDDEGTRALRDGGSAPQG